MAIERDFIRLAYALALELHDAGINVTSVGVEGSEDEGIASEELGCVRRVANAGAKGSEDEATAPQCRTLPPIWYHGDRTYSLNGDPIVVTIEEDYVLQAFLEKPTAMTKRDLEDKSGVTNAPRVLTALTERYRGVFKLAIRRPGAKGQGGYFIRVLPIISQT